MNDVCPNINDCHPTNDCEGCSATWAEFPVHPWKSSFIVVILSPEDVEKISEMAFRDEAARMWQQKENEDLAYEGEI